MTIAITLTVCAILVVLVAVMVARREARKLDEGRTEQVDRMNGRTSAGGRPV